MTATESPGLVTSATNHPRAAERTSSALLLGLLAVIAVERPLRLLAHNVDTGVSLAKLALHSVATLLLAVGLARIGRWAGLSRIAATVSASIVCLGLLNWQQVFERVGWWAPVFLVLATLIVARLRSSLVSGVAVVIVVVLACTPLLELGRYWLVRGESVLNPAQPLQVQPGNRTEDVVVVVLDEYAGRATLSEVGYESGDFVQDLVSEGFSVPEVAWSTATSTFLSIPEMLEMRTLVPADGVLPPATDRDLYRIMGGSNRFVRALKSAGYTYTHVEGGWEGTACGPHVDNCVQAPWLDSTAWELWRPSALGGWLEQDFAHPFVHAGLAAAETLPGILAESRANGRRDLVIAHVLLPHNPFVLGPDCSIEHADVSDHVPRLTRYIGQVQCAESVALQVARSVGDSTAVLITSDHGTTIDSGLALPYPRWPDHAVAERLNVFMAYRLPAACTDPHDPVTLIAMTALMSCAVDGDIPVPTPTYSVVMHQRAVDREPVFRIPEQRVTRIRAIYES